MAEEAFLSTLLTSNFTVTSKTMLWLNEVNHHIFQCNVSSPKVIKFSPAGQCQPCFTLMFPWWSSLHLLLVLSRPSLLWGYWSGCALKLMIKDKSSLGSLLHQMNRVEIWLVLEILMPIVISQSSPTSPLSMVPAFKIQKCFCFPPIVISFPSIGLRLICLCDCS